MVTATNMTVVRILQFIPSAKEFNEFKRGITGICLQK
jgi:hypothetical protein